MYIVHKLQNNKHKGIKAP